MGRLGSYILVELEKILVGWHLENYIVKSSNTCHNLGILEVSHFKKYSGWEYILMFEVGPQTCTYTWNTNIVLDPSSIYNLDTHNF